VFPAKPVLQETPHCGLLLCNPFAHQQALPNPKPLRLPKSLVILNQKLRRKVLSARLAFSQPILCVHVSVVIIDALIFLVKAFRVLVLVHANLD